MKAASQQLRKRWVHLSCAYWVPEISFGNIQTKQPIEGFERVNIKKLRQTCSLCRNKGGVCISCHKSSCSSVFHAECGRKAGLHAENMVTKGHEVIYKMHCERHRPLRALRTLEMGRKRAAEEVIAFARAVKSNETLLYSKKFPRRKKDRVFNKGNWNYLMERIRQVCERLNQFTLIMEKPEKEGDNYKLVPTFFETKYTETLRRGFPWNAVKFGKFSAAECRREYLRAVPDNSAFESKVMHRRTPKPPTQLLIDTTHYCKCCKFYLEDQSTMIGKD
eukprot:TRINITY_DN3065_c0_g5_i1.p1 TRINITY_DN3065_c0_g5~~TRINITY_DN3065_c0_g5_i1.p1  ORF type:complete len:277 (-),score=53.63 TRINITY_DN3065_c0_g5_i1:147-977(-)